jgi:hypothetical protein
MGNQVLRTVRIKEELMLPDNDQWQFRFEIRSETSTRIYVIAQHKQKKHWGCSCPGWKAHRKCKHLEALDLPAKEQPLELNVITY